MLPSALFQLEVSGPTLPLESVLRALQGRCPEGDVISREGPVSSAIKGP